MLKAIIKQLVEGEDKNHMALPRGLQLAFTPAPLNRGCHRLVISRYNNVPSTHERDIVLGILGKLVPAGCEVAVGALQKKPAKRGVYHYYAFEWPETFTPPLL